MRLALLHPDDYENALAGGCKPFKFGEPVPVDDLRVCADDYYPVNKGECDMWTLPNIDRVVDDWYDRAPLFPGDEAGTLWRDHPWLFSRRRKP